MKDFNITQVAILLGVHRDTIIYWEEKKLIPEANRNPGNNYRVYSVDAIKEIAKFRGIFDLDIDNRITCLRDGRLKIS